MKKIICKFFIFSLLAVQLGTFTSCQRKVSLASLQPQRELQNKMPFAVEPYVREETLDANYNDYIVQKGTGQVYYTNDPFLSFFTGFANAFTNDKYTKDERKSDTRQIIERDIVNNFGQKTGRTKLRATAAVAYYWQGKAINPIPMAARLGLGMLSALSQYNAQPTGIDPISGAKQEHSLGIPLLVGTVSTGISSTMLGISRWRKMKSAVDIEITLSDMAGNRVALYKARGTGQAAHGWWPWHYTRYGAVHYSNILAVTDAMNNIKAQIDNDYENIMMKVKF